jgi:hypothetical protein
MTTKPIILTNPVIARAREKLAELKAMNLKSNDEYYNKQKQRRILKEAKSLLQIKQEREHHEQVAAHCARQALHFMNRAFFAHDRARGPRITPSISEQNFRAEIEAVLKKIAGIS